MVNRIPKQLVDLVQAARTAANGLKDHGASLGIATNTETNVRADIADFTTKDNAYGAARVSVTTARNAVNGITATARLRLTLARDALKPTFGTSYNQAWDIVGLVGSLEIPREVNKVHELVAHFEDYYTQNPGAEIPTQNITAAQFEALFNSMDTNKNALKAAELARDNAKSARDDAAEQLRKRLRDLIKELSMKIDGTDARWKVFGFNPPDILDTPAAPTGIVALLIGPTAAALKWNKTARAKYYRVWKKVNGVDQEMIAIGNPADLDFAIEGLPAHSTIQIAVSAVNDTGESALSPIATLVTT